MKKKKKCPRIWWWILKEENVLSFVDKILKAGNLNLKRIKQDVGFNGRLYQASCQGSSCRVQMVKERCEEGWQWNCIGEIIEEP